MHIYVVIYIEDYATACVAGGNANVIYSEQNLAQRILYHFYSFISLYFVLLVFIILYIYIYILQLLLL